MPATLDTTARSALTRDAAADMGRTLRWIRHARELTLRDVAKAAGLSVPYVQNIERAERLGVSEEALARLAKGYGIDASITRDLLFQARIASTLERYGLDHEQRAFVWTGLMHRLAELDFHPQTEIEKVVAAVARK